MEWTIATTLPILTLGLAGAVLPIALARRFPDTLHGLAQALALSIVLLVLLGSVLFVALYSDAGLSLSRLAERPGQSIRHFVTLGLQAALIWGPILALTAIALGQGTERRRGERMAARDPDPDDE